MCRKDYEQTTIGNDNKTFFFKQKNKQFVKKGYVKLWNNEQKKKSGKKGKIEGKKRR